ncbi:hypothetical protein CYY_005309 [Polysphondylium violaceum]|uniref:RhoGAP domain-containing protein n=1 Tax=Polysphondylium violaceum TaxID=133409 RepID=A0A8J4USA7_9MYCE|nr:hypothetical protein CYY_005309 [Polysphondylium violaceum]
MINSNDSTSTAGGNSNNNTAPTLDALKEVQLLSPLRSGQQDINCDNINLIAPTDLTSTASILSFSNDLWDGYDILCKRTELGIEQCKDLLEFFKRRATIEDKYSKSVTEYFSRFKLKDENDSFQKGIQLITKVCEAESNVHKTFSSNLLNNLCHPFSALVKEMEQRRKKLIQEGQKVRNDLKDSIELLKKHHLRYEKQCKEMESVKVELINMIEKEPDANSKVQALERKVAKCESNAIIAEEEYKSQIKDTNEFISTSYLIRMTDNLNEFEQFESMRLQFIKSNIKNFIGLKGEVEGETISNTSIDVIDPELDIQSFIKNHLSNRKVIPPFQFEPYVEGKIISLNSSNNNVFNNSGFVHSNNSSSFNSTSTAGSTKDTLFNGSSNNSFLKQDSFKENSNNGGSFNSNINNNSNTSVSPPQTSTKSIKENIFGFFNKATNNLKSSSASIINSTFNDNNSNSNSNNNQSSTNNNNSNNNSLNKSLNNICLSVFGVELEEIMDHQKKTFPNLEIPWILIEFVKTLSKLNAFKTNGIFTISPSHQMVQQEKQRINEGGSLDSITDVHLLATLLKHWLRDLPNPLISYAIYDEIIESPEKAWSILETGIPLLHRKVLIYILEFLVTFIQPEFTYISKIDMHELATLIAPVLIRPSESKDPEKALVNSHKEIQLLESLLGDCNEKKKSNNQFLKKRQTVALSLETDDNSDDEYDENDKYDQDSLSSDNNNNDDDDYNDSVDDDDDSDDDNGNHNNKNNSNYNQSKSTNRDKIIQNYKQRNQHLVSKQSKFANHSDNDNSSSSGSSSNDNTPHHQYQFQITPNNFTPILSPNDFDPSSPASSSQIPPRSSSTLSFGNSDTFSVTQSDSDPVLVECEHISDGFDY